MKSVEISTYILDTKRCRINKIKEDRPNSMFELISQLRMASI